MGLDFFLNAAIVFILQTFIYMAFPFIILMLNLGRNECRFERKKAKKIALWNSIIVGAFFFILTTMSKGTKTWNPFPAMMYYWINSAILTDKTKW